MRFKKNKASEIQEKQQWMEAPFTSRTSGRFRYIHLERTIVGPKHFHKRKPLLQENILLIKEHEIVGVEGNWVGSVNYK